VLTASASDPDGTITLVDFLAGTNLLRRIFGPLTNGVYNFAWSNAPVGSFSLRAEAVDNRGARSASPTVQIVVSVTNVPPTNNVAPVDLGIVVASTIGHAVFNDPPTNFPPSTTVADFLIDQDQSSGGGGVLPAVSVNWDTNSQFQLTVAAPAGVRFVVAAPPGSTVKFGGFLLWESTRAGASDLGPVTAHYTDLEGTAPEFSQNNSVLSDSHGYFGFIDLESTGVTNSFSFTALTLTATVPPQYTGNGTENYLPHLECSLQLYYSTTDAEDPGSFVSMVPTGPLPIIRMTGASPERGVDLVAYGRPGRTHIVECSTNTASWITIGSGVMPPSSAIKLRDASATTVGSRFYRVVELP